jgi:predicted CopG family antitoxin
MTTVRVSRNTRKRLAEVGTKEESFDDIIRRLINFYKRNSREK